MAFNLNTKFPNEYEKEDQYIRREHNLVFQAIS